MITAAISDRDENYIKRWENLAKRVKIAFDNRNQVAHGAATFQGAAVQIMVSKDPNIPSRAAEIGQSSWWLVKKNKDNTDRRPFNQRYKELVDAELISGIWSLDRLRKEYRRNFDLLGFLIGFCVQLSGKKPSAHLLEE
ncbi:MAG TPA: hypothetical protein VGN96_03445 [Roseococcus sp.]|jgi:hypothetical protein|nr:hypothetical protein [Roseococcus sp.]